MLKPSFDAAKRAREGFHMRHVRIVASILAGIGAFLLTACDDDGGQPPNDPAIGGHGGEAEFPDFVSADTGGGRDLGPGENDGGTGAGGSGGSGSGGGGNTTVEEGDIYRALGNGRLAVFNPYRGLMIVDVSNPAAPVVIGRHAMSGSPVELYVVGDAAYLLLNNWYGYWGGRGDIATDTYTGGLVVSFDLSDPTHPTKVAEEQVPGWIQTSRLFRNGDAAALFVVSTEWVYEEEGSGGGSGVSTNNGSITRVRSFQVGGDGGFVPRLSQDLGGWVAAVQGTSEGLIVARQDDWYGDGTDVSVLLVDGATGDAVETASVRVAGWVSKKTNLDLRGGILRVVSGAGWGNTNTNHLETFSLADPTAPAPVDHDTFGANQQLYATIFLEDRAFFVTYQRQDPFHAFSIDGAGNAQERAEFIVSGWNDFFKSALSATRLLGIGVDDQGGWQLAVSLYDITDLTNPQPLIDRETAGDTGWGWSEAQWDDRAFTVLDDAVNVLAPTGEAETGLVMLPFQGWSEQDSTYLSGVQLFTYSPTTLTRRGQLTNFAPVRRALLSEEETAASLSDVDLACFDVGDPDAPTELGRVDLAPNYVDFRVVGDHGARLTSPLDWYGWGSNANAPPSTLQLVPLSVDPDLGAAVGELELLPSATLVRSQDGLTALAQRGFDDAGTWRTETTILTLDLDDPTQPWAEGRLVTTALPGSYYGYGWGWEGDCFDCGGWNGWSTPQSFSVGQALVFVEYVSEHEVVDTEQYCWREPDNTGRTSCYDDEGGAGGMGGSSGVGGSSGGGEAGAGGAGGVPPDGGQGLTGDACDFYTGSQYCRGEEAAQQCEGEIYHCVGHVGRDWSCEVVADAANVPMVERCETRDIERWWSRARLHVVDLRDRAAPALAGVIELDREDELRGLVIDGDSLWLSYVNYDSTDALGRNLVRWYAQPLELTNPATASLGTAINLPGQLLQVEGARFVTQDFTWTANSVESSVQLLERVGDRARRLARADFPNEYVESVQLDGEGHVLVSHRLTWEEMERQGLDWNDVRSHLAVLSSADLTRASDLPIDAWSTLVGARDGRALFNVPGGLLVVNLDDPAAPFAQAYFPSAGWWTQRIERDAETIWLASGRYGVQRFGLDEVNLQQR